MMRRVVHEASYISRSQPYTIFQRRALATYRNTSHEQTPHKKQEGVGDKWYSRFDISGKVYVVTGGGQGLGFSIAEGLVEAGGTVHVLDRSPEPSKEFEESRARVRGQPNGGLEYHQADVANADVLGPIIADIAAHKQRLDGLVAGPWRYSCV